jgi:hypothetical protein
VTAAATVTSLPSGRFDFTFVTYRGLPQLDADDRLAFDVLRERGFRARAAVWDDPGVDWSQSEVTVLRSTWDYNTRHDEFLAWAEHTASVTSLVNSIGLVRWNLHKWYLQELADRAVPVVPTRWLKRATHVDLTRLLDESGWKKAVAKPAVGLATYGVKVVDASPAARAYVTELLRRYDVMIQPYLASVDSYGERALVFIRGAYSHAVRKTAFQPLLPAGEAGETPVEASEAEIAVASRAVGALPEPAVYARVDLVAADDGLPRVLELELVEPSLFLSMHPHAAERFADALTALRS